MSDLLQSLSRIEKAAQNISDHAEEEKARIGRDYKEKTIAFDKELEHETDRKLNSLQETFDQEVAEEQVKLQREQDGELMRLRNFYKEHHEEIAARLFDAVTAVPDEQ
ncbi:MAG: hypothetical protein Q4P30_04290 [Eubacteriales bacterium]|nr:hypothetical protein [Eubacteriales bacterium]